MTSDVKRWEPIFFTLRADRSRSMGFHLQAGGTPISMRHVLQEQSGDEPAGRPLCAPSES